jgi:DNA-binding CsgD family transcriptional regulator
MPRPVVPAREPAQRLVTDLLDPYRSGMGQGDPTLGLVTDLVSGMARTDGTIGRVATMLDLLADAVDADLGLVVQADPTPAVVRVVGRHLPRGVDDALSRELERMRAGDPLLDPVVRGELTPRSAERELGARAWARSTQRAGFLRRCGADQVCTLPLVGGADFVVAMFARRGEDFREEHLRDLAAIQPVVAAVVALAGLLPLPGPPSRPHLTPRETEVLTLLSRGHSCSRIGHVLGASPRTVEVHLGRIYAKLGVRDRLSAVLAAYDLALIPPRSEGALNPAPAP